MDSLPFEDLQTYPPDCSLVMFSNDKVSFGETSSPARVIQVRTKSVLSAGEHEIVTLDPSGTSPSIEGVTIGLDISKNVR